MDKTMTTKEIAENIGKPDRTVRDWVKSLTAKSTVVAAKSATSSPAYPAQWTLAEVCEIIEEGLGVGAANAFRDNAVYNKMDNKATATTRLPAGAQMLALEKIYGTEEAKKRIDFAMGYTAVVEKPATLQIGSKQLSKAAYAVEMEERKKEDAKKYARGLKSLFD